MPDLSNIYSRVTARILADLEQGVRPWTKPWQDRPGIDLPLRHNGLPYRGINVLILWDTAIQCGYANPHWMTFKQAVQLGGRVKKGELSGLSAEQSMLPVTRSPSCP